MRTDSTGYIYQQGSSPNTRVAISMKNKVFSTPYGAKTALQVGVLSTFSYEDSRTLDAVRAVGFGDRVVELVPGVTDPTSLRFSRTLLYTSNLLQELGYRGGIDGLVRSLRQHRWPFDIQSELVFSEVPDVAAAQFQPRGQSTAVFSQAGAGGNQVKAIVTRFLGCWLESYSLDFSSDNALVMEEASGKCTDVTDGFTDYNNDENTYGEFLDAGNRPTKTTGSALYR